MTTTIGKLMFRAAAGLTRLYYERLVALTRTADTECPEVKRAKQFLAKS
jgi:hypothetical protein